MSTIRRRMAIAIAVSGLVIGLAAVEAGALWSVARPSQDGGAVAALLGTGELVRVDGVNETVTAIARLPLKQIQERGRGPFIARAGGRLFAATSGGEGRLYRVDLAAGRTLRSRLLGRGSTARAVLVGPRSRRLYVVVNATSPNGPRALSVFVFSANGDQLLRRRVVKSPADKVFNASISSDEQRIAVSYHGVSDGFDVINVAALTLACPAKSRAPAKLGAGGGCLAGHGSVHFAGSRLFTSTGGPYFDELIGTNSLKRRDPRLGRNHFLEFTGPARGGHALYVVGVCGYAGGLGRLDLRTGKVAVLSPSGRGRLCGARMFAEQGGALVVASNEVPFPQPADPGRIVFVNGRTGAVVHSVATAGSVVDVASIS